MNPADIDEILERVRTALNIEDWDQAVALVEALRPPDQADVFAELPPEEQEMLLPRLNPEDSADILEELEEEEAAEVVTRIAADELAPILNKMEPDELADLLGDIQLDQVLEALPEIKDIEEVRTLLVYPDNTAGGLMTSAKLVLHQGIRTQDAIAYLRETEVDSSDEIYILFVVDDNMRLVGQVTLRQLVLADPDTRLIEIMDPEFIHVHADADQEEAAQLMARYDLLALPVIDANNQMLGVITHDDMVEVLQEEATEDIYRLGGVPEEQAPDVSIREALRNRLPWLVLNLGTAMASAAVLSLFESTIAQIAVLAAFFPIVAGVSGSAGTQTLTVTVRGLALGEISSRHAVRSIVREVAIGLSNGVVVGGLVAVIALAWKGTPMLGVVVGASTLLTMICAGFAGVLVPLGMQFLKIDPALASPVLVTTTTDALGYLIYLSIATLLLIEFL